MKRITKIISDPQYKHFLVQNEQSELNRSFCRHDFNHLLHVARLTYLLVLENNLEHLIRKDVAYAAGLLHDIGRWHQYENGSDHAQQSAILAKPLLLKAGFEQKEIEMIIEAIMKHRNKKECGNKENPGLPEVLKRADNLSRPCLLCPVKNSCNTIALQYNANNLEY